MHFQFHVTMESLPVERKEEFVALCNESKVKPVLIELDKGDHVEQPMFTQLIEAPDLDAALAEVKKTTEVFSGAGYSVARVKAEIDPKLNADYLDDSRYYEWHCLVKFEDQDRLQDLCSRCNAHLSRNALAEGQKFVTIRTYDREEFYRMVAETLDALRNDGFEIVKEKYEYSVYDTRLELDKGWA